MFKLLLSTFTNFFTGGMGLLLPAIAILTSLGLGTCAFIQWKDRLREEGRQEVLHKQCKIRLEKKTKAINYMREKPARLKKASEEKSLKFYLEAIDFTKKPPQN